jgi:galactosamine-6-phosphate isomerase
MLKKFLINNVHLAVADNYEEMSLYGAGLIFKEIQKKRDLLMCPATGSTPTLTYDLLAKKYPENSQLFSEVRFIKLDEWAEIPVNNPATCEVYLQKHLLKPLKADPLRIISFKNDPEDPENEIKRVSKELAESGNIDLCILGMGLNGHLGFNEPGDHLIAGIHLAELADTLKRHDMIKRLNRDIRYGFTLGMNDIMRSKKILLLVNGSHKKEAFKRFFLSGITTHFPATMLWMHPDVTVLCDQEALPDIKTVLRQ